MNEKSLLIQEKPHYLITFREKSITYIPLPPNHRVAKEALKHEKTAKLS
jgi:hypothetical protein